jgi:hypothetical protein
LELCDKPKIARAADRFLVMRADRYAGLDSLSAWVPLKILDRALVLLCFSTRREGAKVAAPPGLGVDLSRIEAITARFQFPDHCQVHAGLRFAP